MVVLVLFFATTIAPEKKEPSVESVQQQIIKEKRKNAKNLSERNVERRKKKKNARLCERKKPRMFCGADT
jgi:hypothetical protein